MKRFWLLLALAVWVAQAGEKIAVYESDHFELITDGPRGRAQQVLGQFERVRSFLARLLPLQEPLMKPRVVLFNGEKDFREVSPNQVAAAYYVPIPHRDMIAIGPTGGDEMRVAVHEYLHLLARQADQDLPLWLNEGIAELYSTIRPVGTTVQVGMPVGVHLQKLREGWMDLATVVRVNHESAEYNRKAHAGTFYAASWALTHMLQLGESYSGQFGKMAAGVSTGKPADEVFREVYGKSLKQVEDDLRRYVERKAMSTRVFDQRMDKSYDKIEPRAGTAYEWGVARADLLTAVRKWDEAKAQLTELTRAEPQRPEAWESLAFGHWITRKDEPADAAVKAYQTAMERQSANANLAYHSYLITRDAKLAGAALRKLVDDYPNYTDGRIRLAERLMSEGVYAQAYAEAKQLKKINRRQAKRYFPVVIEAAWRLNKAEECRVAALQFQQLAVTEDEKRTAAQWLEYARQDPRQDSRQAGRTAARAGTNAIGQAREQEFQFEDMATEVVKEGSTVRLVSSRLSTIEGVLVNLECKEPRAVLTVKTDAGLTRLLIEDPTAVNLTNQGKAKMELTCGAQERRIKAGYFARENAAEQTSGVLSTLEFLK